MKEPLLYLSLYFKDPPQPVLRQAPARAGPRGMEEWLEFFLRALPLPAQEAAQAATRILSFVLGGSQKDPEN